LSLYLQQLLDLNEELIVDNFAGGGGASSGIEQAFGRPVDIAINHDAAALAMHEMNHPSTYHVQSDVWDVCPLEITGDRTVGFAWFSPDCTGFSKAKGGMPHRHETIKSRSLGWVAIRWAGQKQCRVIILENVEEWIGWGPLCAARDKHGRIYKTDGTLAKKGEYVPFKEQRLQENRKKKGRRFKRFIRMLRDMGYQVEWRELRACDYGAPTIRKRLFVIARNDGQPVVWPEPTHGDPYSEAVKSGKLLKFRTAADCIDWTIPMLSIFATKEEAKEWARKHGYGAKSWPKDVFQAAGVPKRPLEDNTHRRIARGVQRFVIENPSPYFVAVPSENGGIHVPGLVTVAHGEEGRSGSKRRGKGVKSVHEPSSTIGCSGNEAIMSAHIETMRNAQKPFNDADKPTHTVTAEGAGLNVVGAILGGVGGRAAQSPERSADGPTGTTTGKADSAIFAPMLAHVTHEGGDRTRQVTDPIATITGAKRGEQIVAAAGITPRYTERDGQQPRVRSVEDPSSVVTPDGNVGSVSAVHITKFRSGSTGHEVDQPAHTITANSHTEEGREGGAAPIGIVTTNLINYHTEREGEEARASVVTQPTKTLDTSNRVGVLCGFMGQYNAGFAEGNSGDGHEITDPTSTISTKGPHQAVVAGNLVELHGTAGPEPVGKPIGATSASGQHYGVAATSINRDFGESVGSETTDPVGTITPGGGGKAALVYAFLQKYYGEGIGQHPGYPAHTIPTVDRFGVVTVTVTKATKVPTPFGDFIVLEAGVYSIDDIAMRMLQPHELYLCQGFRKDYIIDRGVNGRRLTKTQQVRMVGNSVSPPVAEALAKANCPELIVRTQRRVA
jgi:DNA (cytosine-5)-methyltransferase 1